MVLVAPPPAAESGALLHYFIISFSPPSVVFSRRRSGAPDFSLLFSPDLPRFSYGAAELMRLFQASKIGGALPFFRN